MSSSSPSRRSQAVLAAAVIGLSGVAALPATAYSVEPTAQSGVVAGSNEQVLENVTMDWGVKASLVRYVEGKFGGGSVTVNGVERKDGKFIWSQGTGHFADGKGEVSLKGSIRFRAHGSSFDITITDPTLEFNGSKGSLSAVVDAVGAKGKMQHLGRVTIFTVKTDSLKTDGGVLSLTNAQTNLTAEGQKAFGPPYSVRQIFDPVTLEGKLQPKSEKTEPAPAPAPAPTPAPAPSTPPAPSESSSRVVSSSTLDWGVKASFRTYIRGAIARGSWTVSGVEDHDGIFSWKKSTGSYNPSTKTGLVSYQGQIHFTGHHGTLDLKIENLRLQIKDGKGTLLADAVSNDTEGTPHQYPNVELATVDLSEATMSGDDFSVTDAAVELAEGGSKVFGGFYQAGTVLDSLNFTAHLEPAPAPKPAPAPVTPAPKPNPETPAPNPAPKPNPVTPAPKPNPETPKPNPAPAPNPETPAPNPNPVTPEPVKDQAPSPKPVEDPKPAPAPSNESPSAPSNDAKPDQKDQKPAPDQKAPSPSETTPAPTPSEAPRPSDRSEAPKASENTQAQPSPDARPQVHSTNPGHANMQCFPVVPAHQGASSSGQAKASHESSATGSSGASASSSAAAPSSGTAQDNQSGATTVEHGNVSAANLTWGVKSSFRNYIAGGIAKGHWDLDGTAYSNGNFTWSNGFGNYENGQGSVSFPGSLRFTGHHGLLDLKISGVKLVFANGQGKLMATVTSNNMDGVAQQFGEIEFATVDISSLTVEGGKISLNGAAVTLSKAGSLAFAENYPEGQSMDPISFTADLSDKAGAAEVSTQSSVTAREVGASTPAQGSGREHAAAPAKLAETGVSSPGTIVAFGVAILALGSGAVVAIRRRSGSHSA